VAWRLPHFIGRQPGLFKTKRRGAQSYAKWSCAEETAHKFFVTLAAADEIRMRNFSQFVTLPSQALLDHRTAAHEPLQRAA
jgi:hypothetical protein